MTRHKFFNVCISYVVTYYTTTITTAAANKDLMTFYNHTYKRKITFCATSRYFTVKSNI